MNSASIIFLFCVVQVSYAGLTYVSVGGGHLNSRISYTKEDGDVTVEQNGNFVLSTKSQPIHESGPPIGGLSSQSYFNLMKPSWIEFPFVAIDVADIYYTQMRLYGFISEYKGTFGNTDDLLRLELSLSYVNIVSKDGKNKTYKFTYADPSKEKRVTVLMFEGDVDIDPEVDFDMVSVTTQLVINTVKLTNARKMKLHPTDTKIFIFFTISKLEPS